jgi:hypothetical protein
MVKLRSQTGQTLCVQTPCSNFMAKNCGQTPRSNSAVEQVLRHSECKKPVSCAGKKPAPDQRLNRHKRLQRSKSTGVHRHNTAPMRRLRSHRSHSQEDRKKTVKHWSNQAITDHWSKQMVKKRSKTSQDAIKPGGSAAGPRAPPRPPPHCPPGRRRRAGGAARAPGPPALSAKKSVDNSGQKR